MKTVAERAQELIGRGVEINAAYAKASQDYQAEIDAVHAQALAEQKAKTEAAMGVREFLGVKVSGMRDADHIPGYKATAMQTAIAIKPATQGIDSKTKCSTLFPPQLWLFNVGKRPAYLTQYDAAALHSIATKIGPEKLMETLATIGSAEAVKAWQTAKDELIAADKITNRKN